MFCLFALALSACLCLYSLVQTALTKACATQCDRYFSKNVRGKGAAIVRDIAVAAYDKVVQRSKDPITLQSLVLCHQSHVLTVIMFVLANSLVMLTAAFSNNHVGKPKHTCIASQILHVITTIVS